MLSTSYPHSYPHTKLLFYHKKSSYPQLKKYLLTLHFVVINNIVDCGG